MSYHNVKIYRHKTKERLIKAFNGKCGICGYNKCHSSLGFHHLDPKEKDFGISCIGKSWESLVIEVRKCILVCANCHFEIHEEITEIPKDITRFNEEFAEYRGQFKKDMIDNCPICNKEKSIFRKTCSYSCAGKIRYNIKWDEIDLLKIYKEIGTYTGVAEKLGVSDVTVRKRILKILAV